MLNNRILFFLLLLAVSRPAGAHIGSPNVFFDGQAGPYSIHAVVKPPGVIPGLADISVRVNAGAVDRVTVVPIRWNTGKKGAPRPDIAERVRGESNLFTAQLWFMVAGAQSVEIELSGPAGHGQVVVPVNAVATSVLTMPRGLGVLLAVLGGGLVLLAASIIGAAVRESVLPAGIVPSSLRRWAARGLSAGALLGIGCFLAFGKGWWESEAREYRNNRLFRPVDATAEVFMSRAVPTLRLTYGADLMRRNGPLVPDHGKLMHLFLAREPALDAFAHLHPVRVDWQTVQVPLPPLPAGEYRVYGDITYESGFADTLTAHVNLPAANQNGLSALDRDDAWCVTESLGTRKAQDVSPLTAGAASAIASSVAKNSRNNSESRGPENPGSSNTTELVMKRIDAAPLWIDRDTILRFAIFDRAGNPVPVENYMGMRGHLILRRQDGAVFTHLHPSGSFSMAAKQLFDMRLSGEAPLKIASYRDEPICKVPLANADTGTAGSNEISFPYAFPKPGTYRLWVQTRVLREVRTAVFDVLVEDPKP